MVQGCTEDSGYGSVGQQWINHQVFWNYVVRSQYIDQLLQRSLRKTIVRWGRRDKTREMSSGEKQEEDREKRSMPGRFSLAGLSLISVLF